MAVLLNLGRTLSKTLAKMSVIRETIVQSTKVTISDSPTKFRNRSWPTVSRTRSYVMASRLVAMLKNNLAFGAKDKNGRTSDHYETELEPAATTTRIPPYSQSRRRLSFERSVTTTSI